MEPKSMHISSYERFHSDDIGTLYVLPDGGCIRVEQNNGWRSVEWPTYMDAQAAFSAVATRYEIDVLVTGSSALDAGESFEHCIDDSTAFWRVDTKDGDAFQWQVTDREATFAAVVTNQERLMDIMRTTATEYGEAIMSKIDLGEK